MCGIVGGLSQRNVVPIILEGLSRLEYRGYDSVGIALINSEMSLERERVTGRVDELKQICKSTNFHGLIGIGHTRWATHGGVNVENAHPHFSNNKIAIVHNGIIENHEELRNKLKQSGYVFTSETDTEVIVHLIHSFYSNDLLEAVKSSMKYLNGAYAIGVISVDSPDEIICARVGSPLVLGIGIEEMFFASDISALLPVTQKMVYLEDGDIVRITANDFRIYDYDNNEVIRKTNLSQLSLSQTELGSYRHYMQKEIFEQPDAISQTIERFANAFAPESFGDGAESVFKDINKVQIIACGTSYNAGVVAKYWIEEFTDLECSVEIASEYRYRSVHVNPRSLIVSISQSGETADTLASIKYAHSLGMTNSLAICNVPESSLVRISKLSFLTQAGPEIGVASTKAFTTQLIALLFLSNTLAKVRGRLTIDEEKSRISYIRKLPSLITNVLTLEKDIRSIAELMEDKDHALFLGRHSLSAIASEGALKLKEISYIQAEGYASGELKHGPLALVDRDLPIVVLMPSGLLYDKVKSNVEEVLARHGLVYLFTDELNEIAAKCSKVIIMPTKGLPSYLLPILYVIPLQLLAYHTAIIKGTDVDKPRNLAKSVTVE